MTRRTEGALRGTNLPRMGDFNESVILDTIRRAAEGCSRVELVTSTGLSAQTVSNIVRRLIDRGLVLEAGRAGSGPGKPRTLLRVDPMGMLAAGVHIDPAVLTFVLIDLTGRVIAHSRLATPRGEDPRQAVGVIGEELDRLIIECGVPRDKIVGLGVGAPGPVDLIRGVVVEPPLLHGWHDVPLRELLAAATGLSVLVNKDVTAAAVAETWAGERGSFLFYYLGTGIGAAYLHGGAVERGSTGNAGEVGHIVTDPTGPECGCGSRGCVAVTCTPQSLVDEAERSGVIAPARPGSADLQTRFSRLCELADSGDPGALGIITRSAERTGKAVSVLTDVLDVDRVVFGGPFWPRLSAEYLRRIPEILDALSATRAIRRISVAGTGVGDDVGAVGAACLVLEDSVAPSATRLLLRE